MLARAVSTDLPAQSSRVSHSSGEMKAAVLRFAKLLSQAESKSRVNSQTNAMVNAACDAVLTSSERHRYGSFPCVQALDRSA